MIYNFLFHRVNPKRDALWDPMDVPLFERCIKYISKNFDVRLAEDIYINGLKNTSPKKVATIMFDDGYKDNFEFAAPILKKYGCKASFYIVTNCIEQNIPTWTHVLEYYFSNTKQVQFNFNFDFIPEELNIQGLKSKEERIAYVKKLKPMLKKMALRMAPRHKGISNMSGGIGKKLASANEMAPSHLLADFFLDRLSVQSYILRIGLFTKFFLLIVNGRF